ncbi:low molecular weight protein-tyrosine-phosphatase [Neobacillus dielmonensis]|uniref:low molecular weight protein-tyrosine-phosphatase n=1 Tax=Neobacillus dielmonensis TaxID=1347369 RepID=UPI0005A68CC2|nr:low molecular weight protein-tyrosine-phosphatase [Neobacillus dielmonensis]
MINVLFVCLGNICRSPMAEALFRHLVKKEKLASRIAVDSAATFPWQFNFPPHAGTVYTLKKYKIPSDGLVGRSLKKEDFWKFDYIIGMDKNNIKDIYRITGKPNHPKIFRLLDLTKHKNDIPDPAFTGDFEETYRLVSAGCRQLLKKIRSEHNL